MDKDSKSSNGGGGSAPRRQRAPTITIDTTNGENQPEADPIESASHAAPSGLRPSMDRSTDRPISPHNIYSPTSYPIDLPGNFLSVPAQHSRADAVDSDDEALTPSSVASETVVGSGFMSARNDLRAKDGELPDNSAVMNDANALARDPSQEEQDFYVEHNKFAFTPGQLFKLYNPKSLPAFYAVGGLKGLEKGLRTNIQSGLSVDEEQLDGQVTLEEVRADIGNGSIANGHVSNIDKVKSSSAGSKAEVSRLGLYCDRKRIFTENRLPEKKPKSIFELAWIAYNDKVLIILTVAAVISLALGLYQTFQPHPEGGARVEWVEGVAIMVAIIIVVVVGAANDWQKERQFVRLNRRKEDRTVKVIRSGKSKEFSIYDVLVGDVMHLEPGELVPVDGVYIGGHNVKCDESSATGESDLIRKEGGDQVYEAIENNGSLRKLDPFILSGGKVTEGVGTFLVTGVGVHSSYGKTMMSLREDTEATPLQSKLNTLAEYIAKLGGAAALLLFVVLLIKFLIELRHNHATASQKGQNFLQILIVSITVVVVAVPEGLPLAVTLALAFATTKMLKDNNLVRLLRSCETMGNATTVCSDKTGTLTQNRMTLVAGTVGTTCRFGDKHASISKTKQHQKGKASVSNDDEFEDISASEAVATLHTDVKNLLEQFIAVNTTAFEGEENGARIFIGSKTETALLDFARDHLGLGSVSEERSSANIVQLVPFDSARKCMAAVTKLPTGKFRMYVKGASEILLATCTSIIRDPSRGLSNVSITNDNLDTLNQTITAYASRSLRTLALIYRDFDQWPPKGVRVLKEDPTQAVFSDVFKHMSFFSIVGIQDPLRAGVREAVKQCQMAGVFVRMVTGDNLMTARAIAEECAIYTPGGIVMEGPVFRKLSKSQMDQTLPRLQVLARSSPEDKRLLVKRLKELGETVAVTGDGTNDAPALKTADVGFSMGISGTEVAKEASAIILMDDNFASIVKAIMWGRAVNDSVKKFLQFQVTVNITAVILTFISAVASDSEQSVLTAVQLLWVNLIMDTFAALALATDPPTKSILDRKPDPKSAPLISISMWKMIIGQAIYQLVVTLILYFGGTTILSYQSEREQSQLGTLVFNTFVWMQIFNQYNNRRLDNKFNIFEGIQRNYFFIVINIIIIGGQVMIIYVGGRAFQVRRLNAAQWAYSLILGAFSIPIGIILRLIPDELIARLVPEHWLQNKEKKPDIPSSEEQRRFEWNTGMVEIKEELLFLKKLRGGRLNVLKFKLKHPREALLSSSTNISRSSSVSRIPTGGNDSAELDTILRPATPESRTRRRGRSRSNSAFGPAAAMAGIIAGSVAGWSPIDRNAADEASGRISSQTARSNLSSKEVMEPQLDSLAKEQMVEGHDDAERPSDYATATSPTQSPTSDSEFTKKI